MKRLFALVITFLVALSGCTVAPTSQETETTATALPIVFESDDYSELLSRIQKMNDNLANQNERYYAYKGAPLMPGATIAMAESADQASGQDSAGNQANGSQSTIHSETNIQVAGVDEADIIKTDGRFIYVVINNRLNIIDAANPAAMKIAATIKFSGTIETAIGSRIENVLEMYLDPALKRLSLIVSGYDTFQYAPASSDQAQSAPASSDQAQSAPAQNEPAQSAPAQFAPEMIAPIQIGRNYTMTLVYSIEDPYNPVEIRRFAQEGSYISSRRIGEYVYTVSQKYQMRYYPTMIEPKALPEQDILPEENTAETTVASIDQTDPLEIFPKISETGTSDFKVVKPRQIALVETGDPSVQVVLSALNIKDTAKPANVLAVLGSTGTVYASTDYLYLFGYQMTWNKDGSWAESETQIYRYGLEAGNIAKAGQGFVPGTVLNQFSFDEYKGYLRVATTTGENWSGTQSLRNNLYILDADLKTVGSVTGLAKNETIRSVRFIGDRGYIVTFRTTDPLFVLDLQNPANPRVVGELKIPGYSSYLHLWQENRLLGFGYDVAVENDRAFEKGLKVSLFDIANPASPKEISTLLLGSRGSYTELNNNHKALIADPNVNILAFPALLAKTTSQSPLEYGQPYFQGLVVMSIVNDRIQLQGGISHFDRNQGLDDPAQPMTEDDMNRFYGYDQVLRGAFIGDILFTLSNHEIQASRMTDLKSIGSVELPGFEEQQVWWGATAVR